MSTPIQPVPPLVLASEFPSLADRPAGTYNAKAKAWADSENAMATRTREIALTAKNNAEAATEQANIALQAAQDASDSADAAQVSSEQAGQYRDSAAAIAGAMGDDAGLPSLVGNAGKALVVNPDELAVNWWDILPAIGYRHVTEADTVVSGDRSTMVDCSGAFTLSFDACATLGDGWFTYIKNSGTGDITLDPAGSETIDGLTSYIMYPGEVRLIQCDGSVLRSVVLNSFYKVFETSGDFIKPPGYRAFEGLLWCGGNGGGPTMGGGGGGCLPLSLQEPSVGGSVAVIIGAGGLGGAVPSFGGNSSFGSLTCYQTSASTEFGSSVLSSAPPLPNSVADAAPLGMQANAPSGNGSGKARVSSMYGGGSVNGNGLAGGDSVYGGGAGGSSGGARGLSRFGGNGGSNNAAGIAPGGGGGANANGARGELRIWGII